MSVKTDFEKVVEGLKVVEEEITLCKGQIKELDSQVNSLLEELGVKTVEEAKQKVEDLRERVQKVELDIVEEARKVGIVKDESDTF